MKKQETTQIIEKLSLLDKETAENIAKDLLSRMEQNPGMTLQDATGVSDQALEEIYSLAYTFYNQGKYPEAVSLFEFLAGSSPKCFKYVLGLASSYHQLQAYKEASAGFYIALNIDPTNPLPAYYLMDCFIKQGFLEEAKEFAEIASLICEDKAEYAELKERCDLIRKSLNTKKLS